MSKLALKNKTIPSSLPDNVQAAGQPPGMKPFKQVFWLAVLGLTVAPLLSGCLTGFAVGRQEPKFGHDYADKLEKASITENNDLLIFFEGRVADSPRRGPYTIIVPLSEAKMIPHSKTAVDTNVLFKYGLSVVERKGIVEGWIGNGGPPVANKPIPIGAPIVTKLHKDLFLEHSTFFNERDNYKLIPGAERTLFQVTDARTNLVKWEWGLPDFIYVDATRPEAFTKIRIKPVVIDPSPAAPAWRYCLLPVTVAGDVALSPLYLLYVIATRGGHGWFWEHR
jgi:hypothetical protein